MTATCTLVGFIASRPAIDGKSADGGYHVDGKRAGVSGGGATDLHAPAGRDRPVGFELGDIDQELHGATSTDMPAMGSAARRSKHLPGFLGH